jgi:hypothetical protein
MHTAWARRMLQRLRNRSKSITCEIKRRALGVASAAVAPGRCGSRRCDTSCRSARSYWRTNDNHSRQGANGRAARSPRARTLTQGARQSARRDRGQIETGTPPRPVRIARIPRTGPSNAPPSRARHKCRDGCSHDAKSSGERRSAVPAQVPAASARRRQQRQRTPSQCHPSGADRSLDAQAVMTPKSTAVITTATTMANVRTAFISFSFSSDHVDGVQATPHATHAYFLPSTRCFR